MTGLTISTKRWSSLEANFAKRTESKSLWGNPMHIYPGDKSYKIKVFRPPYKTGQTNTPAPVKH